MEDKDNYDVATAIRAMKDDADAVTSFCAVPQNDGSQAASHTSHTTKTIGTTQMDDGESTENWAIRQPGFLGSIKQLCNCGRCGKPLPIKRHDEPRRIGDIFKPTVHALCDDCYEALP